MLAASVWGDPAIGEYIQTFNGTVVGHEKTAAFLNNLPLILDELQLSRDGRGNLNFDVYKLAQGVGRTRGNRNGGVDMTPRWSNCIITSGESPIVDQQCGAAGAVNRGNQRGSGSGQPRRDGGQRQLPGDNHARKLRLCRLHIRARTVRRSRHG